MNNVKGNLSNNHRALRKELSTMVLDTPTGKIKLDANRNAVADIYLTEVAKDSDGVFFNKLISTTKNVNQYLGLSASEFKQMGVGTRNNPECK
jgi:branched-chain amino acid transport system substrate-binding protein